MPSISFFPLGSDTTKFENLVSSQRHDLSKWKSQSLKESSGKCVYIMGVYICLCVLSMLVWVCFRKVSSIFEGLSPRRKGKDEVLGALNEIQQRV